MSDSHIQFVGSIPEKYDEHLGPMLFHYYAKDLANRVRIDGQSKVLELACGTGISTEYLQRALPSGVQIIATDLNDPMLEYAQLHRGELEGVVFEQADALSLPYEDEVFDAVVCQFGLMFFPDKLLGLREANRVLRPGGQLLFNVWDSFDFNPIARVAFDTIGQFFAEDPPTFMKLPFSYYEIDPIKSLLHEAGFSSIEISVVDTVCERPSAQHVAEGLVTGNPNIIEIQERGSAQPEEVIAAVTEAIIKEFGDNPMKTPLQAIVFSAFR